MSDATRAQRKIATLSEQITSEALAFERRWTLAGLRSVSPRIAEALQAQIGLWHAAVETEDLDPIVKQGEALVRGYRKAQQVMAQALVDDTAYFVGRDHATGFTIVISNSPAHAQAAAEAEGPGTVWLSPHEIAALLPKLSGFSTIAAIKQAFPGAIALGDADREVAA
jgi:hypothetical protein